MMRTISIALLSLILFTPAVMAEEAASKIAVVDMGRVGREAASVQAVLVQVGTAEQSLARLMQTAEAELKALQEKGSADADLKKKQAEIQALIDKRVSEIQVMKSAFDLKIKNDVKAVVDALVKEKSLELILDKVFVASSGLDLTDEFIAKLEKLNPPAKIAN